MSLGKVWGEEISRVMANKGEIRVNGKVMGKDYGRYFYSPRGNMWAVTLCTYDCDDGRMFEK